MSKTFILITGRTRAQAAGLHKGGGSPEHIEATSYAEISSEVLAEMGLQPGDLISVQSPAGRIKAPVRAADMPSNLMFIPMGPAANALIGPETYGTGMPSSKGIRVEVEPA